MGFPVRLVRARILSDYSPLNDGVESLDYVFIRHSEAHAKPEVLLSHPLVSEKAFTLKQPRSPCDLLSVNNHLLG